ncbi:MAG TPA: DUF721 domain-containing protein [Candidatus Micrarchaeia archaeon]|nr:DUF721 domain-containing protein [Candidatus Micrarchaeia archaeon]
MSRPGDRRRPSSLLPLADSLPQVLRRMGIARHVEEARACLAFEDQCGPYLRRYVRALRLEGRALVVTCGHPAVAHQLQLEAGRLLDAVNATLERPRVERLRFVADPVVRGPGERSPGRPAAPPW